MLYGMILTLPEAQSLWWMGAIVWAILSVTGIMLFSRSVSQYNELYREVHGVRPPDPRNPRDWEDTNTFIASMRMANRVLDEKQDDPRLEAARRNVRARYYLALAMGIGGMGIIVIFSQIYI